MTTKVDLDQSYRLIVLLAIDSQLALPIAPILPIPRTSMIFTVMSLNRPNRLQYPASIALNRPNRL